jgi:uncharacterized protein
MRSALRRIGEQFDVGSLALALNIPVVGLLLWLNLRRLPLGADAWGYLVATVLGYYQLPLLLLTLVLCLLLASSPRALQAGVGFLLTAYVYYLLLDCVTYRVCKLHIDAFWIEYAVRDFAGLGLPPLALPTALLALVPVLAAERRALALARRLGRGRRFGVVILAVAMLAFALGQARHVVAYDRSDDRITALTPHLPFYLPFTSHRNADRVGRLLPTSGEAPAAAPPSAALRFPARELEFADLPGGAAPNLVVILLECWRYDMLNAEVTPNIAAFARRAVVFDNHLSSGNSTTCGIFGLLYGLHPTYWSAVKAHSSTLDNPPLIDALRARDYVFGVFADSKFERHRIKDTTFRGIEVHEDFAGGADDERDADMARQAADFIAARSGNARPYLLFAFFKATHTGYRYPPDRARFRPSRRLNPAVANGADAELYLNDYRNALHYDDELVGGILRQLESAGQLDRTIVIITTDHGESFDDNRNNDWGHGSNFTRFQVQVPLVFFAPDRPPQRRGDRTAHVDVAPTLLRHYFGCRNPARDFSNGRDLFDPPEGPRGLVVGSYVNHAFVIGDDVFAVQPLHTRKYRFADIRLPAGSPPPQLLRELGEEMTRFCAPPADRRRP